MSPSRVSVIIRTKNTDWVIAQTLAALFAQQFTDFDILVADSGSTDKTLEIVARYPCRVIHIPPDDYIPGAVLNQSVEETTGGIVMFLNADTVPLTPESVGCLIAAFDDPRVQAAFGRQVARPEADPWVRRDYETAFPVSGSAPEWLPLSLPISAMRRTAWESQPFYTRSWGSEDTEWGVQARKRGWRIAYVPEALAMHSHNYTPTQIYGRRFIEGEADAFIYEAKTSYAQAALRLAIGVVREIGIYAKAGAWGGMPGIIPRVAAGEWGYLKGNRHGNRRLATGDTDLKTGQQTVLARHESVRTPQGGKA